MTACEIKKIFMAGLLVLTISTQVHAVSFARPTLSGCNTVIDVGTWSGNAFYERRILNDPMAPALPFVNSQQECLSFLKLNISYMVDELFVDISYAGTDGTFNVWFSNTNHFGFPMYTNPKLLSDCSLPSDYFETTPHTNLLNSVYGWWGVTSIMSRLIWTTSYPSEVEVHGWRGTNAMPFHYFNHHVVTRIDTGYVQCTSSGTTGTKLGSPPAAFPPVLDEVIDYVPWSSGSWGLESYEYEYLYASAEMEYYCDGIPTNTDAYSSFRSGESEVAQFNIIVSAPDHISVYIDHVGDEVTAHYDMYRSLSSAPREVELLLFDHGVYAGYGTNACFGLYASVGCGPENIVYTNTMAWLPVTNATTMVFIGTEEVPVEDYYYYSDNPFNASNLNLWNYDTMRVDSGSYECQIGENCSGNNPRVEQHSALVHNGGISSPHTFSYNDYAFLARWNVDGGFEYIIYP